MLVDGKECRVNAFCKFRVLEKEPGIKVGRLYLLERQSNFGNVSVKDSEIFVEGVTTEGDRGLSLLFSIEPPLNDSINLLIGSDVGSVSITLYSASSSWYWIDISNFVNRTNRVADVREMLFKEPLNVSIEISRGSVTVRNLDTERK